MSTKSMESAVRELTKTVVELQDKVLSLESLIIDQNIAIKKLIEDKDTTKLSATSSSDEGRQQECPAKTTQRPMREARLRAASTITAAAACAGARKVGARRNLSPLASAALVPSPSLKIDAPIPITSSNRNAPPTTSSVTPTALQQIDRATDIDDGDAAGWIEKKSRRSRRPIENVTRGTAVAGTTALFAAERRSFLHLYFVKPGTTEDQVVDHLRSICPDDKCSVEALKPRGDYASFKLSVLAKYVDKYLSSEHWAEDVHIKPWRSGFRKPSTQKTE